MGGLPNPRILAAMDRVIELRFEVQRSQSGGVNGNGLAIMSFG